MHSSMGDLESFGGIPMTGRCRPVLARLAPSSGEHEQWALWQAYELAPRANFLRAVLERSPQMLAVMRLSAVAWRDLGTPRRVIRTLDELALDALRGPAVTEIISDLGAGHLGGRTPRFRGYRPRGPFASGR
jgi:hypothetical protein